MPIRSVDDILNTSLLSEFDFNRIRSRFDCVNEFLRVVIVPIISLCQQGMGHSRNDGPRFILSWHVEYGPGLSVVVIRAAQESGPRVSIAPIQVLPLGTLNIDEMSGSDIQMNEPFVLHGQAYEHIREMHDYAADLGESGRFAMVTDLLSTAFIDYGPMMSDEIPGLHYIRENENGRSETKAGFLGFLYRVLRQVGYPEPSDASAISVTG